VGDVAFPTSGHPDVRRGGAGVLADEDVGGRDRRTLGTVRRGRVGELDVIVDVGGREYALPVLTHDVQPSGRGADHGPGLAVGDADLGVVLAGGDGVPDADLFARGGDDGVGRLAGDHSHAVGGVINPRDLVAGIGDDEPTQGRLHGEEVLAFDVAGVDHDVASVHQFVEDVA
jgi:hypothetical protein